jgi:hypothetical protein
LAFAEDLAGAEGGVIVTGSVTLIAEVAEQRGR